MTLVNRVVNRLVDPLTVFIPAIALIMLMGCVSGGKQEVGNRQETAKSEIEDKMITGRVKEAILADPLLKSEEITVETIQGTVQLGGFVSSIIVMEKAVAVARGVKGVKEVKDAMRFKWQF